MHCFYQNRRNLYFLFLLAAFVPYVQMAIGCIGILDMFIDLKRYLFANMETRCHSWIVWRILKYKLHLLFFAQIVALLALFIADFDGVRILPMIILVVFNISIVIWIVWRFQSDRKESDINISHILGHDAKDALSYGEIGIITYDEQYNATWINDFLEERHIDIVGKKLTSWISQISDLFRGEVDSIVAKDSDRFMKFYVKKTDRFYL